MRKYILIGITLFVYIANINYIFAELSIKEQEKYSIQLKSAFTKFEMKISTLSQEKQLEKLDKILFKINKLKYRKLSDKNRFILDNLKNLIEGKKGIRVEKGDTVKVDYTGKLEDGNIFDSSIEENMKKSFNYSSSSPRNYEPLEFVVGIGNMIKGFDDGIIGMKPGEKKTITILPKDAYGEKTFIQIVPYSSLQDTIIQEVEKKEFEDIIIQEVPMELLEERGENIKIGEEITVSGVTGKIKNIEGKIVIFEIINNENPFYGKKLIVGLEGEYQGNKLTIKKIDDTIVTIEIQNRQNPFYGKKLIVGLEGEGTNGEKIKIIKINSDNVEVEINNPHKLAGKTLIFDIEIKEIKK